jgi:hypothetical protein
VANWHLVLDHGGMHFSSRPFSANVGFGKQKLTLDTLDLPVGRSNSSKPISIVE